MSLIITFMFEPAKLQMNWARASGTSTLRRAAAGSAFLSAMARRPCSHDRWNDGLLARRLPLDATSAGCRRRHPARVTAPTEALVTIPRSELPTDQPAFAASVS